MEIKEIKNIVYVVCAATLTVVASICGIVLTKKAYGVMTNYEKITKHAANVGQIIDDKQFVEDVKKDVKEIFENHKMAAQELAKATAKLNETSKPGEMGHNLNQAANNLATFTARLNEPAQPGETGHNLNQAANNLATLTNDAREMIHVVRERVIGNSNSQSNPQAASGNENNNSRPAMPSSQVPLLNRIDDTVNTYASIGNDVRNFIDNNNDGRYAIRAVFDTENHNNGGNAVGGNNQQASESNNGENLAGGNNQQVSAPMPNNGGMLNTIRNAFSIVFRR